mgnify:CR=1
MYRGKYNNLIKELVKESKNDLNNNLNCAPIIYILTQ